MRYPEAQQFTRRSMNGGSALICLDDLNVSPWCAAAHICFAVFIQSALQRIALVETYANVSNLPDIFSPVQSWYPVAVWWDMPNVPFIQGVHVCTFPIAHNPYRKWIGWQDKKNGPQKPKQAFLSLSDEIKAQFIKRHSRTILPPFGEGHV